MGERIKAARTDAGYDQQEFAKLVGMSQSALSEVESGRSKEPRASAFMRMVRLLQVSPRWLAEGKGPMRDHNDDERELIEVFRGIDEKSRRLLLASARALKQQAEEEVTEEAEIKRRLHINT